MHDQRTQAGASAIEFVVVMGLVIAAFLMVLQFALKSYAAHVAQAAAEAGLSVARSYDGTAAEARRTALRRVDDVTVTSLNGVQVSVVRASDTATVTVDVQAQRVVPGFDLHVESVVSGPVERFSTTPVAR